MNVKLYIAGTLVDLDKDNLILWNYTQEDLTNPSVVKNSYSQQVTLPGTPTNNALFGDIYRLDRRQTYGSESGCSFNPSKRTSFEIRNDKDEVLESGYIKLDTITKKGNTQEYAVTLYGGLGSFFYALSYDEDGNKRTLADIKYLKTSNKDTELDFTINADFVKACWSRMDGTDIDVPMQVADVINFAPCYNGIPDNFDANKGLINPADCGLQSSVVVDGTTYTTKSGYGYTLVELPEEVTEWAAKDLRSYLQRPVLSIHAFLNALGNPDNCGGYAFDCKDLLNSDFDYSHLWMTLPMLPSLPTYRQESHPLNITTSAALRSGDNFVPITLGSTLPSNTSVEVNYNCKLSIYSAAAEGLSTPGFYRYQHTPSSRGDYYYEDISGMFVQLVAYDASGNAITASKVVCIGDNLGSYNILGTPLGMAKDAKTRAEKLGFTPHFTDLEELWGEYISVHKISRRDESNYYDIPAELSFSLSAYDIASLRLYVSPYHWYKYVDDGFFPWQRDEESASELGTDGQKIATTTGISGYSSYAGGAGSTANTASYTTTDTLRSGAKVTKSMLLTTDYTPADLLLSLTKMFGLSYIYDKASKSVRVTHRNAFYEDETIDIESRIDRSKNITITPLVFSNKWLEMSQESSEGAYEDTYADLYGVEFGIQRIDTGYDFNAESKAIMNSLVVKNGVTSLEYGRYYNYVTEGGQFRPSPFLTAGCKQTLWSTAGATTELDVAVPANPTIEYFGEEDAALPGYDYPMDRKLQLHDADGKGVDGDNILVFLNSWGNYPYFKVTDDSATMNNLNDGVPCWILTAGDAYPNQLRIPIFSRYRDGDGWMIESALDFGRVRELNAPNLRYSEYQPVTIYEKSWKKYLADRYDVDTRVVTCYVDFRGIRVGQELLRKFYHFDNALWVLNKLSNYSLTSIAPVQCEFIKVQDKSNYTEGQSLGFIEPYDSCYEVLESEMNGSVLAYTERRASITINGTGAQSRDDEGFGYVKIKALRDCTINIYADCEASYDWGYLCARRILTTLDDVKAYADIKASGEGVLSDTYSLSAGDEVYIGMTKDRSSSAGLDKVTFYFTE